MTNISRCQFEVASQWSTSTDFSLRWLQNDQHQQISGCGGFTMTNINRCQFVVASQWPTSTDVSLWWLHNDQHQQMSISGGFTITKINRCQFVVASQWSTVVASQWSASMDINLWWLHNDHHQQISGCGGFTMTNINRYQFVAASPWPTSADINMWWFHNDQHQQISICGGNQEAGHVVTSACPGVPVNHAAGLPAVTQPTLNDEHGEDGCVDIQQDDLPGGDLHQVTSHRWWFPSPGETGRPLVDVAELSTRLGLCAEGEKK